MILHFCGMNQQTLVAALAIAAFVNAGVSAAESFTLELDADDADLVAFDPVVLRCTLTNTIEKAQAIPAWVSLGRGLVIRVKGAEDDKSLAVVPFAHVSHGAQDREEPQYVLPSGGKQTGLVLAMWGIANTSDRDGNERRYLFARPGRYEIVAELHGTKQSIRSSPLVINVKESPQANRIIAAIAKRTLGSSLPPFQRANAAPLDELIAIRDHLAPSRLQDLVAATIAWRQYDESIDDVRFPKFREAQDDVLAKMPSLLRQSLIVEIARGHLRRGQLDAAGAAAGKLDKSLFERWFLEVAIEQRRREFRSGR